MSKCRNRRRNFRHERPEHYKTWRTVMRYGQAKITEEPDEVYIRHVNLGDCYDHGTGEWRDPVRFKSSGCNSIEAQAEWAAEDGEDDIGSLASEEVLCRPIWDVPRFDTGWHYQDEDPADQWCNDLDTRAMKAHLVRLMLRHRPHRNARAHQSWLAHLDLLLDALSQDGDSAFMDEAIAMVRRAVPGYERHCQTSNPNTGKRHNGLAKANERLDILWYQTCGPRQCI